MKVKRILFTFILIMLAIIQVDAKEVDAKYEYVADNSVNSNKITSKTTKIKLDDFNISVIDVKEKYKNSNIKIIAVDDDNQLAKLKKQIKNDNIERVYYYIFEDANNNQIDVTNFKIKLDNNLGDYVIYTVNSNGDIVDKSSSTEDEIDISNNNYFVIAVDSNVKKVNYKTNAGGVIVLDGVIISNSGEYTFKSDKMVIRSDSGYELKSAFLNGKDILNKIDNGFLDVSNENNIVLELNFIEVSELVSSESYGFSGQVIYNGKPLANAKVELHSDVMTTATDQNGNFYFENVSLGKHSITISNNDNVIGYSEFLINNNANNEIEVVYKNNEKVITNVDNVDLILYINNDYDVTIKNKEEIINIEKTTGDSNNKKKHLLILPILLVVIVIVIYFVTKNKKK